MTDKELHKQLISRYENAMLTVNRRINAMLRERLPVDLTVDQHHTLRYIRSRGMCTSSELADIFCVGKSSITAIINRLFDKELIVRLPDEKDRRVTRLALTPEGERLTEEHEETIHQMLAGIIGHFSKEEAEAFIGTYEKLARLIAQDERGEGKPE